MQFTLATLEIGPFSGFTQGVCDHEQK